MFTSYYFNELGEANNNKLKQQNNKTMQKLLEQFRQLSTQN